MTLNLTVDELLTTTRSVRKRLDFDKPVSREVLMECLDLALQAPTGSNTQGWQFVFVDDPQKKKALADVYRANANPYLDLPKPERGDIRDQQIDAVMSSAKFLNENFEKAPVDDPLSGGQARRRAIGDECVVLGVVVARRVELHAGASVQGTRLGVDDVALARRRREAGR